MLQDSNIRITFDSSIKQKDKMVTAAQILENNGLEVSINNFNIAVDVMDDDNVQVFVTNNNGDIYTKNIVAANAANKAAAYINKIIA
jgi:hypothetical protein